MATGTIPNTKLGEVAKNQTFPFTVPSDGVVYYSFSANSSSQTAYVYIQEENSSTYLQQSQSTGGMAIRNSMVVKKDWKLKVGYISNATFNSLWFVPFV